MPHHSAKALLLTMLGEFVLPHEEAVWTTTIVEGLGLLDVDERNARQAVSRLSEQGIVAPMRHGRRTRWHLTDSGSRLLTDGAKRIYEFGSARETWDSHWLVVLASVPEQRRASRHQLRNQLAFAGFGFIAPGIAVSPHVDREPLANAILGELDLAEFAIVLLAETGTFVPDAEILRRAWDLEALATRYGVFIDLFSRRQPRTAESRFSSLVELVHAWRRFPFGDPEIPDELLPPDWPGHRAKELFDARRASWGEAGNDWFEHIEARQSSTTA